MNRIEDEDTLAVIWSISTDTTGQIVDGDPEMAEALLERFVYEAWIEKESFSPDVISYIRSSIVRLRAMEFKNAKSAFCITKPKNRTYEQDFKLFSEVFKLVDSGDAQGLKGALKILSSSHGTGYTYETLRDRTEYYISWFKEIASTFDSDLELDKLNGIPDKARVVHDLLQSYSKFFTGPGGGK